jgi:putative ABC transport system permease protein
VSESSLRPLSRPGMRFPFLGLLLLRIRFPGESGEALVGDLLEEYRLHQADGWQPGRLRAWFRRQVFLSLPTRAGSRIDPLSGRLRVAAADGPTGSASGSDGFGGAVGHFWHDLLQARRVFRHRPFLAVIAILTLALGIGANTLIFSIFRDVFLRPLPYPDSEELVGIYRIEERVTGLDPSADRLAGLYAVPYALFLDWQELGTHFEDVGAFAGTSLTMTGVDQPERIHGMMVTSGVLGALGIEPLLGRRFLPEDDLLGAAPSVILSYHFWQLHFGGEPDVIGRQMILNTVSYIVVGVMPGGFYFPDGNEEFWVTFSDARKASNYRPGGYLQVIARLKPGTPLKVAQAQMDGVASHLGEVHPAESEHGVRLVPRHALAVANAWEVVVIFLVAVGVVLLIACANIAGLMLVRAMERSRELAMRVALGAGRGQLVSLVLAESLILTLTGGLLGGVLATVGLQPFLASLPGGLLRATEITVDYYMFLVAGGFTLLTTLLVGLLPALRSAGAVFTGVVNRAWLGTTGGRRYSRAQASLVIAQVALAFTLMATAGLLTRSYMNLARVELGFDTKNLLVMQLSLPASYSSSQEDQRQFFRELLENLRTLPGVEGAASASQFPFIGGTYSPPAAIETADGLKEVAIHRCSVSGDYFRTMGVPLITGRVFTDADQENSQLVAVVNETMAEWCWPDGDAIGQQIHLAGGTGSVQVTVIGVVGDIRFWHHGDAFPAYYMPYSQDTLSFSTVLVRTTVEPSSLIPSLRKTVWDIDRDLPAQPYVLDSLIRTSPGLTGPRFGAIALGLLAAVSALLAVLGIYGLLAFTVSQQTREFGIRIALGARMTSVIQRVLGRGLLLAGIGLVIGLGFSLAAGRLLQSSIYGISPSDPATLGVTAIMVLIAVVAAGTIPAHRATRIDPVETLRRE